jgi:hypothetical protein
MVRELAGSPAGYLTCPGLKWCVPSEPLQVPSQFTGRFQVRGKVSYSSGGSGFFFRYTLM